MTDRRNRSSLMLAAGGALAVACCLVGPAVIGAVAGSVLGGPFGIAGAAAVAVACALIAVLALARRGRRC